MGLPRDIANLEERLRETGTDPFASNAVEGSADAQLLLSSLLAAGFPDPARTLRLCLQALRVQRTELEPRLISAEFVATIPTEVPGLARPTDLVVAEMIRVARHEVVILGYEFTDIGLVGHLAEAATRGVDVLAILDREKGAAGRISQLWPGDVRPPRLFRDRKRDDAAPYAAMHAKCLLADGSDLLITSANFTFHGLHGNIEMGVRLKGESAHEARKIFSHLVECGLVEEIR